MKKLISIDRYDSEYNTQIFLEHCLENIKKDFNKYNFSLVFSVEGNRTNVTITDAHETKPYCGISSKNIDEVESFLSKNLEKIKKLHDFS